MRLGYVWISMFKKPNAKNGGLHLYMLSIEALPKNYSLRQTQPTGQQL